MPSKLPDLAHVEPVIVIDTREQVPFVFPRLQSTRRTLQTGDYSIAGCEELFAVERKSIPDLAGCCTGPNRDRFERELHRLRGYQFKRLLIVGTPLQIQEGVALSNINPASIFGTLRALEIRYDCPVVFRNTSQAAATQIELWVTYFVRELV